MAGLPWFEMDVDFHGDPKIRALASRLREPLADSYVARLYAYCYKHVADRFDAAVASDSIEDACVWRGRKGTLYDALLAVEVLERTPGKVIVHGVAARLAPHVAKREADRIRIAERRDKAAKSIGRRMDVAETSLRRSANVAGNTDKDIDRDIDKETIPLSPTPSTTEGRLGQELKLRLEAGLGRGLIPLKNGQHRRLESILVADGGTDPAYAFIAATCREQNTEPKSMAWVVKVLGEGRP
jgi:hypothetical protein